MRDESGRLHMSRQTTGCAVFCPSPRSSFAEGFAEYPDWCSVGSCLGDVRPDMPVELREVSGAESEEEAKRREEPTQERTRKQKSPRGKKTQPHAQSQSQTATHTHSHRTQAQKARTVTVTVTVTNRKTPTGMLNREPRSTDTGIRSAHTCLQPHMQFTPQRPSGKAIPFSVTRFSSVRVTFSQLGPLGAPALPYSGAPRPVNPISASSMNASVR